ncbi:Hypothetical predicted protein [Paramuricea clavata]|uniref:Uncharacterized protein n=1 Tax=Paramuricea clavata TaxID=317549 RepID=A0A7D9DSH0_PARCT|nr:Hypothetical predicted protein [Paramuricea clavata]
MSVPKSEHKTNLVLKTKSPSDVTSVKTCRNFCSSLQTIRNGDSVLSPYFFTDGGTRYEKAAFVVLESKNPFSNDAKILAKIERGAEGNQGRASLTGSGPPRNTGPDSHQNQNTSPTYTQVASRSSHKNPQQTGSNSHQNQNTRPTYTQVASRSSHQNPQQTGSNSHQSRNTSPTYTQVASRSSHKNPQQTGSNSHQNQNTRPTYTQVASRSSHKNPQQTGSNSHQSRNTSPTYSQVASTNGQLSGENANDVTPTDTFYTESPKGVPILPNLPADHTSAQTSATTEYEKAITKEIIMKDTYDELEKFFGQENVEIERTSYDDINMIFEHESYRWMVCFPKTFPNQPAQLYRVSKRRHFSSSSPCPHYNLEKPLTNHVNILLSIKKNCRLTCKICENICKENLTSEGGPTSPVDYTAQTTDNPSENGTAQNKTVKEIIMKDTYDELRNFLVKEKWK